ncbi:aminotransferase-like domain-containing protein [Sphingomonas nostoxanthinifaciens]|uniref:aminotransferase-like domain-containing protein n=1 Tax=Sphingomonas nostoxanthinifaciens TaxID=2872652 RepID=UPI001CC21BCF|nr:PLP-dependent aminotransferase family protein [Sphingomonas nostoxanthinifaciens]
MATMIETEAGRTEQVMQMIRDRVERRALTPGARLPSVRAMAGSSGFSKSTVVEAYDRLAAEGVIRSRPGSGFYVAAPLAPLALDRLGPAVEREVDPLWMLRQSLASGTGMLTPGCGWLPESWMAEDAIRRSLRTAARSGSIATLTSYAPVLGSEALRILLARRLAEQHVPVGPDQILLTDSGTHALDLACRFLIRPGDTVLVDDPGYFNFLSLLRAHRAQIVSVAMTPTGPDVAALEAALIQHRPRFYMTNSAIHNPTGATLSAATAHRVLKLAEAHDLVIVEDDIFADFEHEPSPRYAAFDGLDRVIRVGSLSKSLSASIRCGHIAARGDWIEALADLRIATSMSGNPLSNELLHTVLTDGSYKRHMEKVRANLARGMARTIKQLRAIGIEPWIEPQAGIFLWARLPGGVDTAALARAALAENIVLAPGNVFSQSESWADHLRFNVAMCEDARIFRFLGNAIGG